MSLHRFYLPPEQWAHDLWLEGQEAKHLVQVLRLAPGEEVLLLDGQGRSGRFAIAETAKKKARLVLQEEQMAPAPESRAVMALAFSKAVRRGFFMEKAVELGAHAVWLWQGDHSQGKLPADAAEACRGQLIAGAKQCGNPWLPQVEALTGGVDELVRRAATAGDAGHREHAHAPAGRTSRHHRVRHRPRGRLFPAGAGQPAGGAVHLRQPGGPCAALRDRRDPVPGPALVGLPSGGSGGLNTPPAKAGGFTVATKVAFRLKPVWPLLKQAEVIPPQFGRFHLHLPVARCIA